MTDPDAPTKRLLNPYSVALTVLWSTLLALSLLLLVVAAGAGRYDESLEARASPAGVCSAAAGITLGLATVVAAVQLGVLALRWHLDPATRREPRARVDAGPRVRNDF